MIDAGLAGLHVSSDLQVSVDGVPAELVADGSRLVLRTGDAVGLITAALGSRPPGSTARSWRAALDQTAGGLAAAGLSARLEGERGTLLELGAGCSSRPARWLLGSRHARFGPPRPLGATAIDGVRAVLARRRTRTIKEK